MIGKMFLGLVLGTVCGAVIAIAILYAVNMLGICCNTNSLVPLLLGFVLGLVGGSLGIIIIVVTIDN